MSKHLWFLSAAAVAGLPTAGCVERVMRITTEPPGARIYVNGEERGVTTVRRPTVEVPFLWYGNYTITIRKDGYFTQDVTYQTKAPPYQWIGPDLFAEIIPWRFRNVHEVPPIELNAREGPPADRYEAEKRRDSLLDRAEELQQRVLR